LYTPSPEKKYCQNEKVTFDTSEVDNSRLNTQPRPSILLSPSANLELANTSEEEHLISKQPKDQDHVSSAPRPVISQKFTQSANIGQSVKMAETTSPSVQPVVEAAVEPSLSTASMQAVSKIRDEIVDVESLRKVCALDSKGLLKRINEILAHVHSQDKTIFAYEKIVKHINDLEGRPWFVPKFPLDEDGNISFIDITDKDTLRAAAYFHNEELLDYIQEQAFTIDHLNAECFEDERLIRLVEVGPRHFYPL
jgi:hypothetical protein